MEARMNTPARVIVAISRQMGSGGAYVGQAVARRLAVRYVDREILQEAAKVLDRDAGELEGLEEQVTSVWTRMAGVLSWGAPEAPYIPPPIPVLYEDDLFTVEARVIREIAGREDAVIVGRAASWVLRDHAGVISVFLHAPEAWRAERVVKTYNLTDLAGARELVRRSDQQRSKFLQSLRGGPWVDPARYHVCLDTSAVGLDESADLIVQLATRRRGA
jgi:CMP/dCMP kinase